MVLLQIINYIYGLKPLKNAKKNAILFKLFWYKVFLKLPNFLMDSVLNPTSAPDFSVSVFHSCNYFSNPYSSSLVIWLDSLYLSIRRGFLSSFQKVLSVKYKLKAPLFSSFDLWGVAKVHLTRQPVKPWSNHSFNNNKKKSTSQCVCLRHSHARSPLVFVFLPLPTYGRWKN